MCVCMPFCKREIKLGREEERERERVHEGRHDRSDRCQGIASD